MNSKEPQPESQNFPKSYHDSFDTNIHDVKSNIQIQSIVEKSTSSNHYIVLFNGSSPISNDKSLYYLRQIHFHQEHDYDESLDHYESLYAYAQMVPQNSNTIKLRYLYKFADSQSHKYEIVAIFDSAEKLKEPIYRIPPKKLLGFIREICSELKYTKEVLGINHGDISWKNIFQIRKQLKLGGFKPTSKNKNHAPAWMNDLIQADKPERLAVFLIGLLLLEYCRFDISFILKNSLKLEDINKRIAEFAHSIPSARIQDTLLRATDLINHPNFSFDDLSGHLSTIGDEEFFKFLHHREINGVTHSQNPVNNHIGSPRVLYTNQNVSINQSSNNVTIPFISQKVFPHSQSNSNNIQVRSNLPDLRIPGNPTIKESDPPFDMSLNNSFEIQPKFQNSKMNVDHSNSNLFGEKYSLDTRRGNRSQSNDILAPNEHASENLVINDTFIPNSIKHFNNQNRSNSPRILSLMPSIAHIHLLGQHPSNKTDGLLNDRSYSPQMHDPSINHLAVVNSPLPSNFRGNQSNIAKVENKSVPYNGGSNLKSDVHSTSINNSSTLNIAQKIGNISYQQPIYRKDVAIITQSPLNQTNTRVQAPQKPSLYVMNKNLISENPGYKYQKASYGLNKSLPIDHIVSQQPDQGLINSSAQAKLLKTMHSIVREKQPEYYMNQKGQIFLTDPDQLNKDPIRTIGLSNSKNTPLINESKMLNNPQVSGSKNIEGHDKKEPISTPLINNIVSRNLSPTNYTVVNTVSKNLPALYPFQENKNTGVNITDYQTANFVTVDANPTLHNFQQKINTVSNPPVLDNWSVQSKFKAYEVVTGSEANPIARNQELINHPTMAHSNSYEKFAQNKGHTINVNKSQLIDSSVHISETQLGLISNKSILSDIRMFNQVIPRNVPYVKIDQSISPTISKRTILSNQPSQTIVRTVVNYEASSDDDYSYVPFNVSALSIQPNIKYSKRANVKTKDAPADNISVDHDNKSINEWKNTELVTKKNSKNVTWKTSSKKILTELANTKSDVPISNEQDYNEWTPLNASLNMTDGNESNQNPSNRKMVRMNTKAILKSATRKLNYRTYIKSLQKQAIKTVTLPHANQPHTSLLIKQKKIYKRIGRSNTKEVIASVIDHLKILNEYKDPTVTDVKEKIMFNRPTVRFEEPRESKATLLKTLKKKMVQKNLKKVVKTAGEHLKTSPLPNKQNNSNPAVITKNNEHHEYSELNENTEPKQGHLLKKIVRLNTKEIVNSVVKCFTVGKVPPITTNNMYEELSDHPVSQNESKHINAEQAFAKKKLHKTIVKNNMKKILNVADQLLKTTNVTVPQSIPKKVTFKNSHIDLNIRDAPSHSLIGEQKTLFRKIGRSNTKEVVSSVSLHIKTLAFQESKQMALPKKSLMMNPLNSFSAQLNRSKSNTEITTHKKIAHKNIKHVLGSAVKFLGTITYKSNLNQTIDRATNDDSSPVDRSYNNNETSHYADQRKIYKKMVKSNGKEILNSAISALKTVFEANPKNKIGTSILAKNTGILKQSINDDAKEKSVNFDSATNNTSKISKENLIRQKTKSKVTFANPKDQYFEDEDSGSSNIHPVSFGTNVELTNNKVQKTGMTTKQSADALSKPIIKHEKGVDEAQISTGAIIDINGQSRSHDQIHSSNLVQANIVIDSDHYQSTTSNQKSPLKQISKLNMKSIIKHSIANYLSWIPPKSRKDTEHTEKNNSLTPVTLPQSGDRNNSKPIDLKLELNQNNDDMNSKIESIKYSNFSPQYAMSDDNILNQEYYNFLFDEKKTNIEGITVNAINGPVDHLAAQTSENRPNHNNQFLPNNSNDLTSSFKINQKKSITIDNLSDKSSVHSFEEKPSTKIGTQLKSKGTNKKPMETPRFTVKNIELDEFHNQGRGSNILEKSSKLPITSKNDKSKLNTLNKKVPEKKSVVSNQILLPGSKNSIQSTKKLTTPPPEINKQAPLKPSTRTVANSINQKGNFSKKTSVDKGKVSLKTSKPDKNNQLATVSTTSVSKNNSRVSGQIDLSKRSFNTPSKIDIDKPVQNKSSIQSIPNQLSNNNINDKNDNLELQHSNLNDQSFSIDESMDDARYNFDDLSENNLQLSEEEINNKSEEKKVQDNLELFDEEGDEDNIENDDEAQLDIELEDDQALWESDEFSKECPELVDDLKKVRRIFHKYGIEEAVKYLETRRTAHTPFAQIEISRVLANFYFRQRRYDLSKSTIQWCLDSFNKHSKIERKPKTYWRLVSHLALTEFKLKRYNDCLKYLTEETFKLPKYQPKWYFLVRGHCYYWSKNIEKMRACYVDHINTNFQRSGFYKTNWRSFNFTINRTLKTYSNGKDRNSVKLYYKSLLNFAKRPPTVPVGFRFGDHKGFSLIAPRMLKRFMRYSKNIKDSELLRDVFDMSRNTVALSSLSNLSRYEKVTFSQYVAEVKKQNKPTTVTSEEWGKSLTDVERQLDLTEIENEKEEPEESFKKISSKIISYLEREQVDRAMPLCEKVFKCFALIDKDKREAHFNTFFQLGKHLSKFQNNTFTQTFYERLCKLDCNNYDYHTKAKRKLGQGYFNSSQYADCYKWTKSYLNDHLFKTIENPNDRKDIDMTTLCFISGIKNKTLEYPWIREKFLARLKAFPRLHIVKYIQLLDAFSNSKTNLRISEQNEKLKKEVQNITASTKLNKQTKLLKLIDVCSQLFGSISNEKYNSTKDFLNTLIEQELSLENNVRNVLQFIFSILEIWAHSQPDKAKEISKTDFKSSLLSILGSLKTYPRRHQTIAEVCNLLKGTLKQIWMSRMDQLFEDLESEPKILKEDKTPPLPKKSFATPSQLMPDKSKLGTKAVQRKSYL